MFSKKSKALFNPENYHGWTKTKKYFEGWYYKLISEDQTLALAIIPGIAMDENGKQQAFIQVLNGSSLEAEYFRFPAEKFLPHPKKFELNIGENFFSQNHIKLRHTELQGELHFKDQVAWPKPWYSPGIMGPFSFVPFMECYHGILSMDHEIEGEIEFKGQTLNFDGGRGYMEKDWGHSFPSAYIWMQSNHFSKSGISLKASVAKIPWLGSSFVGFIAGVWLDDQLIQFTTYNLTKLKKSQVNEARVEIIMENRRHKLHIIAHRSETTSLASPIAGFMDGRISESMSSQLEIELYDKRLKKILLKDIGKNAGLEVAGNIPEILI